MDLLGMVGVVGVCLGMGGLMLGKERNRFKPGEQFLVTVMLGMVIWVAVTYLAAWLDIRGWVRWVMIGIAIWGIYQLGIDWFKALIPIRIDWFLTMIIILGVTSQLWLTAPSGLVYENGMRLYGVNAHDGMWHVALMKILGNKFPPMMPNMSGERLSSYHYLIDLWGSELAATFNISAMGLVYRWLPLIFSIIMGLTVYYLVIRLSASRISALTGVFLNYFAGSLAYLLPLFITNKSWGETSFWAQQSVSTFINLPLGASLTTLGIVLLILVVWFENTKSLKLWWLAAFLGGMTVGIKAYTGILIMAGFGGMAIYFLLKRNIKALGPALMALLVFLGLTLGQIKGTENTFIFEPGYYLKAMMEAPDRVGWVTWELKRQVYMQYHNIPRIIWLWGMSLFVFIFGNLGVRVLGLWQVFAFQKNRWTGFFTFMAIVALGGIIIPLLVLQRGIVWNTIQFLYVSLFVLNIYTALFLAKFKNKVFQKGLMVLILMVAIPTTFNTLASYTNMYQKAESYQLIDHKELLVLNALKSLPYGKVLTPYQDNAYVTGISGKETFFTDDTQAVLLGIDPSERKNLIRLTLCQNEDRGRLHQMIIENQIKYILINKEQKTNCPAAVLANNPNIIEVMEQQLYRYEK